MRDLQAGLEERKRAHLYRKPRVIDGATEIRQRVDGRAMLAFCSNDYLGLANHPLVKQAAIAGVECYGVGSGASHLVNGHSSAHQALEQELAEWTGRERALLFSSGYLANLAVAGALVGRKDTVIQDRLNHASLLDSAHLSEAKLLRYQHNDLDSARQQLMQAQGERLLMTDGVFSMDGDLADLPALAQLCSEQDAWLMVDDAHGLGVLGNQGGGSLEHFGLSQSQVPILMGTLGKAFGIMGAFVAGSADLIETLIQQARSYIFTTASPPALAEATRASLQLVRTESWRRQYLAELIQEFRAGAERLGLQLLASTTPIQPVLLGTSERALAWSQALEHQGILVPAIRPPTVPQGAARLRITFSAAHQQQDVRLLLDALAVAQESD